MKDTDVAYFSEQLGLTKEIVEASIEDGTLSQRIKDSTKDQVVYKTQAEFDTFKTNHKTQIETAYFSDLVAKAIKGDIPRDLHTPIKGAALQQFEREMAKKHGVETYTDANDLIDQIVKTSANGKGDPLLLTQLQELKTANSKLVTEKEEAVQTTEKKYRTIALEKDKAELLGSVPFDFSNTKPDELESSKLKIRTLLKSVFDAEHTLAYNDNNKLIVMKGDQVLKDPATLEPLPAKEVFTSLAKEYNLKLKSPDNGGQGGSSSSNTDLPFSNGETFAKYCKDNNILQTSAAGIKLWADSGLKE